MKEEAISRAQNYSEKKLKAIRDQLSMHKLENSTVITFGSYARREASQESDIDYIVVGDHESNSVNFMNEVEREIAKEFSLEPASDGAFAKYVKRSDMLSNLGGPNDTNLTLTWRLLLLLEGEWLSNEREFKKLRRELIERYVHETIKDHQLTLFLLNDIIRYWRTMTVDYMYKTDETGKPWAIRNIKLVFSRKLMYASGLFSVGMTADCTDKGKVDKLEELFSMSPIERMKFICGSSRIENALRIYDFFLERMEDPKTRMALKSIKRGDHHDPTFRDLKNQGHIFTRELLNAFEGAFHSTHPIRRAVIF